MQPRRQERTQWTYKASVYDTTDAHRSVEADHYPKDDHHGPLVLEGIGETKVANGNIP